MTLTKHVTKYKYVRKWMVEFLGKSQSSVIKIARVNSIRMTKFINLAYFNFLYAVPRDDVIESTRFLMRPPVNHSTMHKTINNMPLLSSSTKEQVWKKYSYLHD